MGGRFSLGRMKEFSGRKWSRCGRIARGSIGAYASAAEPCPPCRAHISLTSSRGTVISSILPGRVRPKQPPGKTIRRGPRPRSRGRGPHDQTAQFLMRTQPKSRRTFGPLLIAHQQWRCPSCGASSTIRRDGDAAALQESLGWLMSKGSQLKMPGQGRSFRRRTARFWEL